MPFEILSGVIGTALSKLLSKILPPRNENKFSNMPSDLLQERNTWFYRGILFAAVAGFAVPIFLFIPIDESRVLWGAGATIGLPFASVLACLTFIRLRFGSERMQEFLFFYEQKVKTHIYVAYFLVALFAPIGVVSLLFLLT